MIYAPIRMHSDGEEFVQWMHVSNTRSWTEQLVKRDAKWNPDWEIKYPLVRIGEFEAKEVINGKYEGE